MYLEHANITVEDADKTVKFLQTAFPDFAIRGEGSLTQGGHWLHVGNDTFYMALQQNNEHQSDISTRYLSDGINHVGIVVDQLNPIQERLQAGGYAQGHQPDPHPFRRRVYFYDPNGIEWEFVQYLSDEPGKRNSYSDD